MDACAHVLNSVDDDVPCRTVYTCRPDVAGEPSGDASTCSVNKRSVMTSSYVNDNNRICGELVIHNINRSTYITIVSWTSFAERWFAEEHNLEQQTDVRTEWMRTISLPTGRQIINYMQLST